MIPVACFAPSLTDEKLEEYKSVAETADPVIKDAMQKLIDCVQKWWDLPASTLAPVSAVKVKHRGRVKDIRITPLEESHKEELFDLIPWDHEINAIQTLFDGIDPSNTSLRDAAFHLLWHVKELNLDREPLTNEVLQ